MHGYRCVNVRVHGRVAVSQSQRVSVSVCQCGSQCASVSPPSHRVHTVRTKVGVHASTLGAHAGGMSTLGAHA
eukprot:1962268-Rhodomonas_salina.2